MARKKKFITCINCIDGRAQEPAINFLKKYFNADYVDLVTEAGPDLLLSEYRDKKSIDSIKRRVKISIEKHGSKVVAICAHHDCAANPGSYGLHLAQLKRAIKNVANWRFKVILAGLWFNPSFKAKMVCFCPCGKELVKS